MGLRGGPKGVACRQLTRRGGDSYGDEKDDATQALQPAMLSLLDDTDLARRPLERARLAPEGL